MGQENIIYEEGTITKKNRSQIVVDLDGREEKRYFLNSAQHDLVKQLQVGDKVFAVLNEMLHDHVPGEGIKNHLQKIVVPGDPEFKEVSVSFNKQEEKPLQKEIFFDPIKEAA